MKENALSDMTLEELWTLFPIFLVEHTDKWAEDFKAIDGLLRALLADFPLHRISHIGSTAIEGIWAKDIVDVLVEVGEQADLNAMARLMERHGFMIMSADAKRISLNRGYTEEGFADRVYHIHLRHTGDNDELYFRDYLNDHPDAAKAYEALKLDLWKRYPHDRDAYTEAKTAFVREYTDKGRLQYGARY